MAKLTATKQGTCKLTGQSGKFVKSHLLPLALSRPAISGSKMVEGGPGRPLKMVSSSWYDTELVTRRGEDILANYDSEGIAELRRHKLVWSSWGPMVTVPFTPTKPMPGSTICGFRLLDCDGTKLRLFFLSILWRFVSSSRPEFRDISIPEEDQERLRTMLLHKNPKPTSFYSVTLVQILDRARQHNQSPYCVDEILNLGNGPFRHYAYRFYMDGLVAHIHRPQPDHQDWGDEKSPLIVGCDDRLYVQTQKLAGSTTQQLVGRHILDAFQLNPERAARLLTPKPR